MQRIFSLVPREPLKRCEFFLPPLPKTIAVIFRRDISCCQRLARHSFRFVVLLVLVVAASRSAAISLTLDDHSTQPYWGAPLTAFDYPSAARVIIVTGTDNWPYNNVNLTNVRVCNAQGVPLIASINIPQGTPIGTVVYSAYHFDGTARRFNVGIEIWGYPHHIETYYGDPNPYVGDAVGDGWTITHTKSGVVGMVVIPFAEAKSRVAAIRSGQSTLEHYPR